MERLEQLLDNVPLLEGNPAIYSFNVDRFGNAIIDSM